MPPSRPGLWFAVAALAALSLLVPACAATPTCEQTCEAMAGACGGHPAECSAACQGRANIDAHFGCTDAFEAMLACDADKPADAACARVDPCGDSSGWNACILATCGGNPADKACRLLGCTDGGCFPFGVAPSRL